MNQYVKTNNSENKSHTTKQTGFVSDESDAPKVTLAPATHARSYFLNGSRII